METLQDIAGFLRGYWGLWLMLIFVGLIAWTLRPSARQKHRDASRIPLEDDQEPGRERKD